MQNESATTHGSPPTGDPPRQAGPPSAVELAAARGIGPLSPLGMKVWHGESFPCVSCGELVRRNQIRCSECGQDLSLQMIMKMQAHAGPWYVHEHIRPFPGVTLDRLIRQIRRGVLTPTTIVRGPTTYHQWRFAAETPGLSKHLGLCWNCQAKVSHDDKQCGACRVNLDEPAGLAPSEEPPLPPELPIPSREELAVAAAPIRTPESSAPRASEPAPSSGLPAPSTTSAEDLQRLHAALRTPPPRMPVRTKPLPTRLIIGAIMVATVLGLLAVVKLRERAEPAAKPSPTPTAVGETVETGETPDGL